MAILGNSGSGKSTLARWFAARTNAALLDLDTVAWEQDRIAVPRDPSRARADVQAFCRDNAHWVIEGCYAGLVEAALAFLLAWVRDYYAREDDMSLAAHRRCFDAYGGPKQAFEAQVVLDPPEPRLLACLHLRMTLR